MKERFESPEASVERYLYSYDDKLRNRLVQAAIKDRDELAVSHRRPKPFKVGAAVCCVVRKQDGSESLETYSAANFTPEPKKKSPEAKWCAERVAIALAWASSGHGQNRIFIPAIVTVSSEVDTGEGGMVHDVLHPCPECQELMKHLLEEGILDSESKLCNINDKDPKHFIMEETTIEKFFEKQEKELREKKY